MSLRRKFSECCRTFGALGLLAGLSIGCGDIIPDELSGDSDSSSETTTLSMSGALAVTGSSSSLALAEAQLDAYQIYCLTFESEPKACAAEIDATGNFSKDCANYANASFGCFLRQDNVTLGTISFDIEGAEDTSIAAGGGTFVFSLTFDVETGQLYAVVDKAASSSLGGTVSGDTTEIPAMSGDWSLTCLEADGICFGDEEEGSELTESMGLHISDFTVGDKRFAAIWESEAVRNRCITDDDETKPNFQITLNNNTLALDLTNRASIESSIDSLWGNLPSDVRSALITAATDEFADRYRHCQSNSFGADNCKFHLPQKDIYGGFIFPSDFENAAAYSGTPQAKTLECSFLREGDKPEDNVIPCPGHLPDSDGDGKGSFTIYVDSADPSQMVHLLCKSPRGGMPMMFPTPADTLSAAVSAMSGGSQDPACKTHTGTAYAGLTNPKTGVIESLRRNVLELLAINPNEASDHCRHFESALNSFSDCENSSGHLPPACHEYVRIKNQAGFQLSNGKLAAGTNLTESNHHGIHIDFTDLLCPSTDSGDGDRHSASFKNACRQEFASKTATQQLQVFSNLALRFQPASQRIICGGDSSLKTSLLAAAANSCVPEVFLDNVHDPKNNVQQLVLRCPGSADGGRCFNSDGIFVGRLPGRHAVMLLKPGVNGAFSMGERVSDEWNEPDPQGGFRKCKAYHSVIFNSFFDNPDSKSTFVSDVQINEGHDCGESESEDLSLAGEDEGPRKGVFKVRLDKQ